MAEQPTRTGLIQRHASAIGWGLGAIVVLGCIALPSRHFADTLREPELITGYSLFGLCLLLAALNGRKRLSVLPLIKISFWKTMHWVAGLVAAAAYWLHVETWWPTGLYEQALAALFYLVTLTGIVGFTWQQILPRRLTQSGVEVIFEQIPNKIVTIREQAEDTVLACTKELGSDTLARFYVETFQWFFRRPRFILSHARGGQRAAFWIAQQLATVRRYLSEKEIAYLEQLQELAEAKARLDLHYAAQGLLKVWLLVHVPLAAAMLVLAAWHMLLVNVYSL